MIISRGRARVALHTYSTSRVGGSVLALRVVAWHTCGAGLWAPTPVIQPGPFALKCVLCQVTSAQYRMHNALYDMQCRVDPSKPECSGATAVPAPRPPLFSSLVTRVVRALRLKVRMYGLVLGTLRGQGHVATTARSFGPSVEPVLSSSSALSSTSACCPSPPPDSLLATRRVPREVCWLLSRLPTCATTVDKTDGGADSEEALTGEYTWTIESFSKVKQLKLYSPVFQSGQYNWCRAA